MEIKGINFIIIVAKKPHFIFNESTYCRCWSLDQQPMSKLSLVGRLTTATEKSFIIYPSVMNFWRIV